MFFGFLQRNFFSIFILAIITTFTLVFSCLIPPMDILLVFLSVISLAGLLLILLFIKLSLVLRFVFLGFVRHFNLINHLVKRLLYTLII